MSSGGPGRARAPALGGRHGAALSPGSGRTVARAAGSRCTGKDVGPESASRRECRSRRRELEPGARRGPTPRMRIAASAGPSDPSRAIFGDGVSGPGFLTAAAPVGRWPEELAVLHILLASACEGSLVFQRSAVAGGRFGKDECATTYPFAHSSHSRTSRSRADPQDSAAPHSSREERMCNAQSRARARGSRSPDPRSARPEAQARTPPGVPRDPWGRASTPPKPAHPPGSPRWRREIPDDATPGNRAAPLLRIQADTGGLARHSGSRAASQPTGTPPAYSHTRRPSCPHQRRRHAARRCATWRTGPDGRGRVLVYSPSSGASRR